MVHIGVPVPFKPGPFIHKTGSFFNKPPKRKKENWTKLYKQLNKLALQLVYLEGGLHPI